MPDTIDTKVVVVFDVYTWQTPGARAADGPTHNRAFRGDHITVSAKEFERGYGYGALAREADAPAAQAERNELEAGVFSDEELSGLSAEELIAYVGQHPTEAQRVFLLEQQRSRGPRKTVVAATGVDDPVPGAGTVVPATGDLSGGTDTSSPTPAGSPGV